MYPDLAPDMGGNVFRSQALEAKGDWCPSRSSKPVRPLTGPGGFDSRPPPPKRRRPVIPGAMPIVFLIHFPGVGAGATIVGPFPTAV